MQPSDMLVTVAFLWGAVGLCTALPASGYRAGPEVDLGYEIHRATVSVSSAIVDGSSWSG